MGQGRRGEVDTVQYEDVSHDLMDVSDVRVDGWLRAILPVWPQEGIIN